jgi:hypothetical protein
VVGPTDHIREGPVKKSERETLAVPNTPVSVNSGDSNDHHAGDPERRDARQEADSKTERTEELGSNRQQGEYRGNSGVREMLHGSIEARAAKPAENFLGTVRKHHYCKSDPQNETHDSTVRL